MMGGNGGAGAPHPPIGVRQPLRAQTLPLGADGTPGGAPSNATRYQEPVSQWTPQPGGSGYDFPEPRAPGLYSQPNHSSPALAVNHLAQNSSSIGQSDFIDSPPLPAMDDINLGLENMHFSQRGSNGTPSSFAEGGAQGGQDGAMEIRGERGNTASVYSLESSAFSAQNGPGPSNYAQRPPTQPGQPMHHGRHSSQSSIRTYGTIGADNVDGYSEERPHSTGSYLPYDQPSSYQQPYSGDFQRPASPSSFQQHPQQYPPQPPHPQHHPNSYGPPPPNGYPAPFQPQAQQAGWGFDYSAAQQQNPYYAAATGQLGFPDGGFGPGHPPPGPSPYGPPGGSRPNLSGSVSSLGSNNKPGGSTGGQFQGSGGSLSSGPTMRRKATSGSQGSNNAGPPITKASVDEYRNRIKADPDPEAQFNFAKYLIEAAKKINSSASGDEKAAKKYRDALLAESVKLIKRLATTGSGVGKPAYADAQFFLANCLGNGSLGLQVDHEKAYNLYVQASKQNHASATYRTAVCNEVGAGTRRDHARAVLFYRKASALGDTAGMYKLGMILLNGLLGQQKNVKDAITWLKRAAVQADEDNPHALHELGLLYEKAPPPSAPGTPQPLLTFDPTYARELFTTAGQYGYPPSQFKLGSCYEYGTLTCPVDPRRSIAWYTRAAERGDAESELALSGWYLTGSEGILKQSDSEAYLWARRAANKGLPKAEYAVGYYSEVGIGVKQDLEEAKRWYMRAAAQGNKRAMTRLSELREMMKKDGGNVKGGKQTKADPRKR